jgi:hypothetical protein
VAARDAAVAAAVDPRDSLAGAGIGGTEVGRGPPSMGSTSVKSLFSALELVAVPEPPGGDDMIIVCLDAGVGLS